MFGSLLGALKSLQGEGGVGQGLMQGLGDFASGFSQSTEGSENPWGQAIGQIAGGVSSGLQARAKEKGMPPRVKEQDVPLAGPPGGGVPPMAAPGAGIPGAPQMGPPPSPDEIGMEPLRFKDQYANRPLMF